MMMKTPILTDDELAVSRNRDVSWVQKWLNENCGTDLEVDIRCSFRRCCLVLIVPTR